MKITRSLVAIFAITTALSVSPVSTAQETHNHDKAADHSGHAMKGKLAPVEAKDAAWAAKAKAEYPTDMCVVSGEKLGGDMGKPLDFIYREEGKPDRLVRFCCKDCMKDFDKDQAKYLKALDDAAAKKTKTGF